MSAAKTLLNKSVFPAFLQTFRGLEKRTVSGFLPTSVPEWVWLLPLDFVTQCWGWRNHRTPKQTSNKLCCVVASLCFFFFFISQRWPHVSLCLPLQFGGRAAKTRWDRPGRGLRQRHHLLQRHRWLHLHVCGEYAATGTTAIDTTVQIFVANSFPQSKSSSWRRDFKWADHSSSLFQFQISPGIRQQRGLRNGLIVPTHARADHWK